jgi:hypothetical protein
LCLLIFFIEENEDEEGVFQVIDPNSCVGMSPSIDTPSSSSFSLLRKVRMRKAFLDYRPGQLCWYVHLHKNPFLILIFFVEESGDKEGKPFES